MHAGRSAVGWYVYIDCMIFFDFLDFTLSDAIWDTLSDTLGPDNGERLTKFIASVTMPSHRK